MREDVGQENWLSVDQIEDFVDSLEHSARLSACTRDEPRNWKWLILALHSALHGASVWALCRHDGTQTNVLDSKSRASMLAWLYNTRRNTKLSAPRTRMASLMTLVERVQEREFLPEPYTIELDYEVVCSIRKLNDWRNRFVHFEPVTWIMETGMYPEIVQHVASTIEKLTLEDSTAEQLLSPMEADQILGRIRLALAKLRTNVAPE